jgi:hypothetical protein
MRILPAGDRGNEKHSEIKNGQAPPSVGEPMFSIAASQSSAAFFPAADGAAAHLEAVELVREAVLIEAAVL